MQPELSIVVCTRNRGARLAVCLQHLLESVRQCNRTTEIIVVDNASSDDTPQLIVGMSEESGGQIVCVSESKPGLSFARNTALAHASGQIVAFVDDDVYVSRSWAQALILFFDRSPDVGLVAGRVVPARDGLQPIGFLMYEQPFTYATKFQCFEPMGANFAARRSVFDRVGAFDVRLGAGRFFASGEDTDFFYRAIDCGYRMDFDPAIEVRHDHDRETVQQSCRLVRGYGRGLAGFLWKHLWLLDLDALRMTYSCSLGLIRAAFFTRALATDERARARARVQGYAEGFVPALLTMWRR